MAAHGVDRIGTSSPPPRRAPGHIRRCAMTFTSIRQIRNAVSSCTDCQLCVHRTNPVAGKGSPGADIILVGEAPGRNEDRLGEPFVGEAGKKLSIALQHANISRGSVYITNVVKCRPPGNRMPTPEEIGTCRQYLDFEIRLIRPKIVCIMGNTAYGSLLGGGNITKDRGKIIQRDGRRYFLTIHPAAAIYRPSLLDALKEDMVKLASVVGDAR